MVTQNVCRYFKFGHCKFGNKCRLMHVKEMCENFSCDANACNFDILKFVNSSETTAGVNLVTGAHISILKMINI